MLVIEVGATEGAWAGTAGQEGARARMTRQGWVRAGESGPKVREEGAGPERRDAEFSGRKLVKVVVMM